MDQIEQLREIFKTAALGSSLTLVAPDIEAFAERVWFSLCTGTLAAKLNEITSQLSLPLSSLMASALASHVRNILKATETDPLFDLPISLAERFRILVFPINQRHTAGASALVENRAFVFVSTQNQIDVLFICAHQLAHLAIMATRKKQKARATIDAVDWRIASTKSPIERFADLFAVELLIPLSGLAVALQSIRRHSKTSANTIGDIEILYVSRIFGVSFLAAAKRCELAGLLPKGGAVSLHQFLVDEFGGPEQRAVNLDLPARPRIQVPAVPRPLEVAIAKRFRNGDLSLEDASLVTSWSGSHLL